MHYIRPDDSTSREGPPLYDIRDLSFTYPDGTRALRDISLSIRHGDRIALVGHNGSGKTTLVRHLNGLHQARQGILRYKGLPLDSRALMDLRLEVGILFQDPDNQLFCNTLYEDVAFGPMNQGLPRDEVDLRVREALRTVDLEQYLYKPPHHLSYGQKKRAALATVLAMHPAVLILDEPTANLDPRQEKIFRKLLEEFSGTLICITHDLLFLHGLCNRAVVLANGQVHHDFGFDDLVSHPPSLREHGLDFTFRFACCHNHPHRSEQSDPAGSGPAGQPVFQLRDYSFRYPDGTRALRQVSMSVSRGEAIAVVGENGAGKSTLASILLGTGMGSGAYLFEGEEVTAKNSGQLWRKVGIVFQDAADQLFCPSCGEEVAFGPRQLGLKKEETARRVTEALRLVHLEGYEERVPLNMSGGERKRLAIASILAMEPEVLILDEPTAGLDPKGEEGLLEILRGLHMTLILITHDLFFIKAMTRRVIVMHQGAVIRDYPTTDFLADSQLQAVTRLDYAYKDECCHRHLGGGHGKNGSLSDLQA